VHVEKEVSRRRIEEEEEKGGDDDEGVDNAEWMGCDGITCLVDRVCVGGCEARYRRLE